MELLDVQFLAPQLHLQLKNLLVESKNLEVQSGRRTLVMTRDA